jgi:hypothetical protein
MDQLNTDQIDTTDTINVTTADTTGDAVVAGDFLAAEDLEAWRRSALVGESIVYYRGPGLMRARVKDAALDRTAAIAFGIYASGRGSLVQYRRGDGLYEYRLQAANTAPVQVPAIPQPASRTRTKVVQV